MKLKIIGAGYGRTGTKSLQLALERLGYNQCYHMESLLRNPAGVKYWKAAHERKAVDWDALFEGYQAIVDFPGSMYYKELAAYYPDAKIILTVRDPESWHKSAMSTIYSVEPSFFFKLRLAFSALFSSKVRNFLRVALHNKKSLWNGYFEGRFADKAYAIQRFKNHIEAVKRAIPAERLLIFDVREGWEPLCQFLGKEVPAGPFPRSNKKENFRDWAQSIAEDVMATG
jgi:hypothetical protein